MIRVSTKVVSVRQRKADTIEDVKEAELTVWCPIRCGRWERELPKGGSGLLGHSGGEVRKGSQGRRAWREWYQKKRCQRVRVCFSWAGRWWKAKDSAFISEYKLFKFQDTHFLAVCASRLTPLILSFLVYKMGTYITSISRGVSRYQIR